MPRLQICHEFTRFSTYMPAVKVANFFGGIDIKKNREELKKEPPQIVVGTPGRIKQVRNPRPHACQSWRSFLTHEYAQFWAKVVLPPLPTRRAWCMQLGKEGALKLGSVRHFVLDECDKMLDKTGALTAP